MLVYWAVLSFEAGNYSVTVGKKKRKPRLSCQRLKEPVEREAPSISILRPKYIIKHSEAQHLQISSCDLILLGFNTTLS